MFLCNLNSHRFIYCSLYLSRIFRHSLNSVSLHSVCLLHTSHSPAHSHPPSSSLHHFGIASYLFSLCLISSTSILACSYLILNYCFDQFTDVHKQFQWLFSLYKIKPELLHLECKTLHSVTLIDLSGSFSLILLCQLSAYAQAAYLLSACLGLSHIRAFSNTVLSAIPFLPPIHSLRPGFKSYSFRETFLDSFS